VASKKTVAPVLVADEDEKARHELSQLLVGAGYDVIEAATGKEAIRVARERHPSLALIEVALVDFSGYEVCRMIREEVARDARVIFLSSSRTESYDRVAGLLIGADDYVIKPYAADELLARIRALLRPSRSDSSWRFQLTARELEVLRLLAEGLGTDEIGDRLFITTKTVGTHIGHVFLKLSVRNRAQAVATAFREGLVGPSP
jgi:DNA-binding NarL/FixJ family response regulator